MTRLYYIHDPMCSWCWGYAPTWKTLLKNLPNFIEVEYVVGGLAPDSNSPMPVEQQNMIQNHWRNIEKKLGTEFNYDFWANNTPRRSTYNACRAVIAADNQGFQQEMIEGIQQAYYLHAKNPSDIDVLIRVAEKLGKQSSITLNVATFINDLKGIETEKELCRQIKLARTLTQQGFPSLVIAVNGVNHQIVLDYRQYEVSLTDILQKIN